MAVDAHHLHVFPSQLLKSRYQISHPSMDSILASTSQHSLLRRETLNMNSAMENYAATAAAAAAAGGGGVNQSIQPGEASFSLPAYYGVNTAAAAAAARKRAREPDRAVSFLGEDISSHIQSQIQNQMQEVDRLLAQHAEKVRLELAERRRRYWRLVLAAAEEGAAKRLRLKEEEVERAGKLNWALEERVRSLFVENQIWKDLAQANEAAANALRSNLEQVLAAQVGIKEEGGGGCGPADDAESCCCGDNNNAGEGDTAVRKRRVCRGCGEREPSVLLLPCRHLCLCGTCAPAANACPICNFAKDGSVNVNIV